MHGVFLVKYGNDYEIPEGNNILDQYEFLDLDDIDAFNGYLYQEKRTAKDKAKMWSLLDKSLQIINKFP